MKRIIISAEAKVEIMKQLKVHHTTVSQALRFRWKSRVAQMIQSLALNKYNGIIVDV